MNTRGRHVRKRRNRWDKQMWLIEPELKRCSTCERSLPLADFSKNRSMRDGYQNVCNGCKHDYWNRWYHEQRTNPVNQVRLRQKWNERALRASLKRYGLTHAQYLELVAHGCAICGGPPGGRRYLEKVQARYAFDHDHRTNQFRGLLCSSCNLAVGLLRDDPGRIAKVLEYLRPRSRVRAV